MLASKVKVARPLSVPLDVVCSHDALDVAVQDPPSTTISESLPPAGPFDQSVGSKGRRGSGSTGDLLAEDVICAVRARASVLR